MQPGFVHFGSICKSLSRPENYVSVDRAKVDAYGIPIPVVHFRFGDNDRALYQDSIERAKEILAAAGARKVFVTSEEPGGLASHEAGTSRMGNDPRTSVVNSYCQTHDVKNLFVLSGSSFTTLPEKNPTHTIMALSVRATRYIIDEVRNRRMEP